MREEFNNELPLTQQQQQDYEEDYSLDDFDKLLYLQNKDEEEETEVAIYFKEPISHYKVSLTFI